MGYLKPVPAEEGFRLASYSWCEVSLASRPGSRPSASANNTSHTLAPGQCCVMTPCRSRPAARCDRGLPQASREVREEAFGRPLRPDEACRNARPQAALGRRREPRLEFKP